jgi:hypothetical protein
MILSPGEVKQETGRTPIQVGFGIRPQKVSLPAIVFTRETFSFVTLILTECPPLDLTYVKFFSLF